MSSKLAHGLETKIKNLETDSLKFGNRDPGSEGCGFSGAVGGNRQDVGRNVKHATRNIDSGEERLQMCISHKHIHTAYSYAYIINLLSVLLVAFSNGMTFRSGQVWVTQREGARNVDSFQTFVNRRWEVPGQFW